MSELLRGLTEEEVRKAVENGHTNVQPDKSSKSGLQIVLSNIFTYFNLIFAILAVLVILAGSYQSLTFMVVVVVNTIIGIIQQLQAKKVLDDLSLLAVSECTAVRNGQKVNVPVDKLVSGDLVILESGMQIPADAVVVDGKVSVNESLITGESDEIEKIKDSEMKSGSFVVSGKCYARLTHVGMDSYVAKLMEQAKKVNDKQSEMVRSIDLIVKIAGIAIIPIGITLFFQSFYINENGFSDSVVSAVAAVVGMIPEGLYLIVTIALAMSAARLAINKVLLHDMRSTETLARVDVLCVDKTGTITSNEMNVTDLMAAVGTEPDKEKNVEILSSYVSTVQDRNITMAALKEYFSDKERLPMVEMIPFSSKTKYSEIKTADRTYRFGAPEMLLTSEQLSANEPVIREKTGKGQRVLAFVMAEDNESFKPLVFVSMENGLRPNVSEIFDHLQKEEVEIKVISGDNPETVSSIASVVGIKNADKYVDASALKTDTDIALAVEKYTVFGRVKPDKKKAIVHAIKSTGKKTAMTGDGVNDILAMKEADCSIAIGSGSDAAMQAAQVVLLDSDFSHMKEIIAEGRRDINNITRSATLFLYKNIFSMLLAIFSIIGTFTYPLKPSQISLVSAFNIGLPALLLAMEDNTKKQKMSFMKTVIIASLPAALTSFFAIASMVVFGMHFNIASDDVGVASMILLSVVGFMILYRICQPFNKFRLIVMFASIGGLIFSAILLPGLFSISYISTSAIMLVLVFAIAEESLMRNITALFDHLNKKK